MKRSTQPRVALAALLLVGLPGAPAAAGSSETLRVRGSTTLFPIAEVWVDGFRQLDSEATVELAAGGTTAGIAALLAGDAEIALASRPATAEELARAAALGRELERVVVARDALGVIVHAENPVAALSRDQLRAIFSGELTRWDQVGGAERPIAVVNRNPESHTRAFFREQILGESDFAAGGAVTSNRAEMVARVASDPEAVGFCGLGDAINSAQRDQVKLIRIAAGGDAESSYAVSRPLFFYVARPRSPAVDRFVGFVLGAAGQALITETNFFPVATRVDPL